MLAKLRDIVPVFFAAALVGSYAGAYGYYSFFFGFDISSYLALDDLTFIFSKDVVLAELLLILFIKIMIKFYNSFDKEKSWWNKTIGSTLIKRRAFFLVPLIIFLIAICFLNQQIGKMTLLVFCIVVFVLIIILPLCLYIDYFNDIAEDKKQGFMEWANFAFVAFILFIFLPLFTGTILAGKSKGQKISVIYENGQQLSIKDSTNLFYIGKTTNYFFIENISKKNVKAYRMDKVTSFEILGGK